MHVLNITEMTEKYHFRVGEKVNLNLWGADLGEGIIKEILPPGHHRGGRDFPEFYKNKLAEKQFNV